MLKDLNEKLKSSQNEPPKPKLTQVKIQYIDKEIAKNLAMYGNPHGIFTGRNKNKPKNIYLKNDSKTLIEI